MLWFSGFLYCMVLWVCTEMMIHTPLSFEMSVRLCQTTRCHIREDGSPNIHLLDDHRSDFVTISTEGFILYVKRYVF